MKLKLFQQNALIIVFLTVAIVSLLTVAILIRFQKSMDEVTASSADIIANGLQKQLESRGALMATFLAKELMDPLYRYDMEGIGQTVRSIKEQKDLRMVQVFDRKARLIYDGITDSRQLNEHLDDKFTKSVLLDRKLVIRRDGDTLWVSSPILLENELLGGVSISLSLLPIRGEIETMRGAFDTLTRSGAQEIIRSIAGTAFASIIIGIGLALYIARRFSRPIEILSDRATRIGQGDYGVALPTERSDEIGDLTISFNKMADDLRRTTVSRDYVENIINSMMDTLVVLDKDEKILTVNTLTCELLGYREDELVGESVATILAAETKLLTDSKEQLYLESGVVTNYETNYQSKNGDMIPMLVSVSDLRDTGDKFKGTVIVARDITEIKRAERNLKIRQFTVDKASEGIGWMGPDGNFIDVNDACSRILGFPRKDFLNMNISDLNKAWDRESWQSHLNDLSEHYVLTFESEFTTSAGGSIPVEVSSNYLKQNELELYFIFFHDIRKRKLMEKQFIRSQKLDSVSLLAGGIAHDFNNFLTAISGNVSLALMELPANSKVASILRQAEQASSNAKGLTQQLLTFAKGGEPIKQVIAVEDLLKSSADFAIAGTDVKNSFKLADDLQSIEVDEGQIKQVISNVVINAQQAMPGGGIIHISADNKKIEGDTGLPLDNGDYVCISIRDSGHGIPKKHLDKIFDPYYTTKSSGHGLGLAATYSIVKNHGGYIKVESEIGEGSNFTIYLPASGCKPEKVVPKAVIETGAGNILLMDDDEYIRDCCSRILSELGYNCQAVGDGSEAIDVYQKSMNTDDAFSAVILDLTVRGGMGGKETIQKMRMIDPNLTAIVSSGYSNDPVLANYQDFGFQDILLKPYDGQELSLVLSRVLSGPKPPSGQDL